MSCRGVLVLTAFALGVVSCDQKRADDARNGRQMPIDTSIFTAQASNGPGQTFADTIAAIDRFEIEVSKLALVRSSSENVRVFAQDVITAGTRSGAKLISAGAKTLPVIKPLPDLTTEQQDIVTALKGQSGFSFDRAYVQAQQTAHEKEVELLEGYAASGAVPSLKAFATEALQSVKSDLEMAKSLQV